MKIPEQVLYAFCIYARDRCQFCKQLAARLICAACYFAHFAGMMMSHEVEKNKQIIFEKEIWPRQIIDTAHCSMLRDSRV